MSRIQITLGNAVEDGRPFNSWFIGDLARWDLRDPSPSKSHFGLRQSHTVELKWGEHRAGETRADWATCSDQMSASVLLRGKFLVRFRSQAARDEIVEHRLEREGDYVVWGSDVEHTWLAAEDAVILTVRWRELR